MKGVSFHKATEKWQAYADLDGKRHYLGLFLSQGEAEKTLVKWKIENSILTPEGREPTIHEAFSYSNGDLFLKYNTPNKRAGDRAGCKTAYRGYVKASIGKQREYVHRLVWEMFQGPIPPGMEIDHINGVRSDNRIENLRLVTRQENRRNARMHKRNSSGCHGVRETPAGTWAARISDGGRTIYIGTFMSFEAAKAARLEAEAKHGFHKNHGSKSA